MWRRRRIPSCAACGFRTAFSSTGNSPASPISPSRYGGGYSHVTTRANIQIREIPPKHTRGADRGNPGHRIVLARLRRRQYPQRHGNADRRNRSAGIDRHPRLRPRMALPHPQRPLADRIAAQVQCRFRRRRQDCGARRHQRYRFCGGRSERWFWCRAGRLVSSGDRRHHRSQGFRQGNRDHRPAGGRDQGRRCHRPGVHRHRRPHQSPQGAHEICDRRHGCRKIHGRRRGEARPASWCGRRPMRWCRVRRSTGWRISACIRRSRPA